MEEGGGGGGHWGDVPPQSFMRLTGPLPQAGTWPHLWVDTSTVYSC